MSGKDVLIILYNAIDNSKDYRKSTLILWQTSVIIRYFVSLLKEQKRPQIRFSHQFMNWTTIYLSALWRCAQSIIEPSYSLTLSKPACLNCKYLCAARVPE